MERAQSAIESQASDYNSRLEVEFGGSEIQPTFDYLDVAYPFHVASNMAAVEQAAQWAEDCGITFAGTTPRELAQTILVDTFDFTSTVRDLLRQGANHVISLDKGTTSIISTLVSGAGVPVIDASTPTKRDALARPGEKLSAAADYSQYAPRVITLPDGKS